MNMMVKASVCPRFVYGLAMVAVTLMLSSTGALAQFHAIQDEDGNTIVLDTAGQEVDIAPADPVGVRPTYCPGGSYYAFEVQSDKTELVLADCVTSSEMYTVEIQSLLDGLGVN